MMFSDTSRIASGACWSAVDFPSKSEDYSYSASRFSRKRWHFRTKRIFIMPSSLTRFPSEGSQARSKATDSRSVLAGVPRFKSGPSHILILIGGLMFKQESESMHVQTIIHALFNPSLMLLCDSGLLPLDAGCGLPNYFITEAILPVDVYTKFVGKPCHLLL